MRMKCMQCSYWEEKYLVWHYFYGEKTDWRPSAGYNPGMRQFRCKADHIFYTIFTKQQLELEKKEG